MLKITSQYKRKHNQTNILKYEKITNKQTQKEKYHK